MVEINNRTKSKINLKLVSQIGERFLKENKLTSSQISIAFVGDQVMRRLNKARRGIDKPTDILSFPEDKKNWPNFLGEIIIDYAQIKRQAKKFSDSIEEELVFILVHGLYHLLGLEDKTTKGRNRMERLGKEFIKKL